MESTRREELRPLMKELPAAAVKSATLIVEAAGFTPTPERMDELSRLLNGFVFSNLTIRARAGRARCRRSCGPTAERLPRLARDGPVDR